MRICFWFSLVLLGACSTDYARHLVRGSLADMGLVNEVSVTRQADWVMHSSSRITLLEPELTGNAPNPSTHPRAHAALKHALHTSFHRHFPSSIRTQMPNDVIASAAIQNSDYLVAAKLIGIEDNLNTRSELFEGRSLHSTRRYGRDVFVLQLRILDARSRRLLDVIDVQTRAALFSGDTSDMGVVLQSSMDELVASLIPSGT